jgi:uncharacterized membrane protein
MGAENFGSRKGSEQVKFNLVYNIPALRYIALPIAVTRLFGGEC